MRQRFETGNAAPARTAPRVCPHLPQDGEPLSYRSVQAAKSQGNAAAYKTYLQYAQQLWLQSLPARALLALDKALLLALPHDSPALAVHPIPYPAVVWFLREVDRTLFFGNPRAHYQHLADRMPVRMGTVARCRMWACWHLTCRHRPDFPADPKHPVNPPSADQIKAALSTFGYEAEANTLNRCLP